MTAGAFPRLDQHVLASRVDAYRLIVRASGDDTGTAVRKVVEAVDNGVLDPLRSSALSVGLDLVSEERLRAIRLDLRRIAGRFGYPDTRFGDGSPKWGTYDRETARVLHATAGLMPTDAGSREVWAHMNGWLVPDLVLWRWGLTTEPSKDGDARFGVGVRWSSRNQMGRLWWRQEILGDIYTMGRLGEDQLTALLERPALGFNPPLARAVALEWSCRSGMDGGPSAEDLMRDATKRLRRLLPISAVYSLAEPELMDLVSSAFDESEKALSKAGPS